MAKFNNKAAVLLNLALLVSLLLIINRTESRQIAIGFREGKATPDCDSVYGAQDGDTCTSVAKMFNLTIEFFSSINPNLNCDDIFVGQWLCVDGSS
ncbi:hypothetical protein MANES_12G082800v8 [Manihot esculenta]|uniref:LysM domain-containing protein n=1 Tax=Manihot esculenta TaxID=3983 RepID=A0A2C9UWM9_MANES|nr:hypothetical protein MANES_12G082800v8 [Manihot esculenta]